MPDEDCPPHTWLWRRTPDVGYWVCLNCGDQYALTPENAFWHASTGNAIPDDRPAEGAPCAAVVWADPVNDSYIVRTDPTKPSFGRTAIWF